MWFQEAFHMDVSQRILLYFRPQKKKNTILLQVASHGSVSWERTMMNSSRQNSNDSGNSTLMSTSFMLTTTTLCTGFSKNLPNTVRGTLLLCP